MCFHRTTFHVTSIIKVDRLMTDGWIFFWLVNHASVVGQFFYSTVFQKYQTALVIKHNMLVDLEMPR